MGADRGSRWLQRLSLHGRYQSDKLAQEFPCSCSNFVPSKSTIECYKCLFFNTSTQHSKKLIFSVKQHFVEESASPKIGMQPRKQLSLLGGRACLYHSTDWSSECASQSSSHKFTSFTLEKFMQMCCIMCMHLIGTGGVL